ncbi:phage tail tube protein [Lacticaseibacillus porcinae]|uniref:phage tail tube protein n=1 Tax=Lacticaseibacillus porcinae TaxID=1123687 RepID=UPI000F7A39E6|nr:hypothetical protein [Lacticaseibacillus porcinae]
MATTTADKLLTHGNIDENFLSEYFTGTANADNTVPTDVMYIGDGIDSVEPKQDDKKNSKAYYNTGGQEKTTVTGSTRSVDFSGDRSYGDPAQDMVAGLATKTGSARNKWLRENQYIMDEDGKLQLIRSTTGIVTWSDITDKGGSATDPGSFKATATYTATPKILDANNTEDAEGLATVLTETPSVNAVILSTTATVKGAASGE